MTQTRNPADSGVVQTHVIVSHRTYAPNLQQPRHAHDSMSVTLVLAGSIAERVGEVEEIGRPLSLVIKPVDVEHARPTR